MPQMWAKFTFLAGIAAFWASGDFALSTIISGRELTLAMNAKTLLGGYRLELASVVVLLSLLIGVFTYFVFVGLGHVSHSKSRT
jgi:hypothetical protein